MWVPLQHKAGRKHKTLDESGVWERKEKSPFTVIDSTLFPASSSYVAHPNAFSKKVSTRFPWTASAFSFGAWAVGVSVGVCQKYSSLLQHTTLSLFFLSPGTHPLPCHRPSSASPNTSCPSCSVLWLEVILCMRCSSLLRTEPSLPGTSAPTSSRVLLCLSLGSVG